MASTVQVMNEMQRAMGRVEGSVADLLASVRKLQEMAVSTQTGVAELARDNLRCHEDRMAMAKRLTKVENKQMWFAGASAAIGSVIGFIIHASGLLPR